LIERRWLYERITTTNKARGLGTERSPLKSGVGWQETGHCSIVLKYCSEAFSVLKRFPLLVAWWRALGRKEAAGRPLLLVSVLHTGLDRDCNYMPDKKGIKYKPPRPSNRPTPSLNFISYRPRIHWSASLRIPLLILPITRSRTFHSGWNIHISSKLSIIRASGILAIVT